MATLKTKETGRSVKRFLDSVKDETMRDECYQIMDWMKKATRKEPKLWGGSIVGFGLYHFTITSFPTSVPNRDSIV